MSSKGIPGTVELQARREVFAGREIWKGRENPAKMSSKREIPNPNGIFSRDGTSFFAR